MRKEGEGEGEDRMERGAEDWREWDEDMRKNERRGRKV